MGQITAFNGEREPLHLISVFPFPLFRSSNKEKYRPPPVLVTATNVCFAFIRADPDRESYKFS